MTLRKTMLCLLVCASFVDISWALKPEATERNALLTAYDNLPLYFIQNQGQIDPRVNFYVKTPGQTLYFTGEGVVFDLVRTEQQADQGDKKLEPGRHAREGKSERLVFNLNFDHARKDMRIEGLNPQEARISHFQGNDPTRWKTGVPTCQGVVYKGIYDEIDLKVFGNGKDLEYEFIVHPGGKPEDIVLTYLGVEGLTTNGQGELVIDTAFGALKETRPYIYQEMDGKQAVEGRFEIKASSDQERSGRFSYGFQVASYDLSRPLIIDPTLSYSTYLGGSGGEEALGIAVDGSGNAYVTGYTLSADFPTQNPYLGAHAGGTYDAFVTKLNAAGTGLSYSTYLGGTGNDNVQSIAVDGSGNAYVTGYTESLDFPTTGDPYQTSNAGGTDIFVTKLNAAGTGLSYSTYLGGVNADYGFGIAVDGAGNAYVSGYNYNGGFPTTGGPYQPSTAGGYDVVVTKLNAAGTGLSYSTYLGGTGADFPGYGIAVDGTGNAYVTGLTDSTDFPTTSSPYQTSNAGGGDAFVTKLNATGTDLSYSTYLGGTGYDQGYGIAVDGTGSAYVSGYTQSIDFPTQNPYQGASADNQDVFVTKLNAAGTELSYSTYLGGTGADFPGYGIAVDGTGSAHVTGFTDSTDFPIQNPYLGAYAGGEFDAFVTKLNAAGTELSYSTYLGGTGDDYGYGIAVDGTGSAYVTGGTNSNDFPTTSGSYLTSNAGGYDAYVTKLTATSGDPETQPIPSLSEWGMILMASLLVGLTLWRMRRQGLA